MEFQNLLEERKSMRGYDGTKRVTREQLDTIISSAILAPSWKNQQTSRYYCIISDEKIKEFSEKCLPEFNRKNSDGAALVVTTFVKDIVGFHANTGEAMNDCGNGWGYYDLGLHNENFILKAKELGLDTLIMGIRDEKAIREFLDIPEAEQIVAVIAVGYGNKDMARPQRKTVEEIAKFI